METTQQMECLEVDKYDPVTQAEEAFQVLQKVSQKPLNLVKDQRSDLKWTSFLDDKAKRSHAYILRQKDSELTKD